METKSTHMAKKRQISPKALAKLGAVFKVLGDIRRLALVKELKQGGNPLANFLN